jgi:hypothetical protein
MTPHGALRLMTAAALPLAAATAILSASHVAVGAIALECLRPGAAHMTRAEPARASGRLTDGEFRNGTRRRRLPFRPWQRRADQRTMDRTFVAVVFVSLV